MLLIAARRGPSRIQGQGLIADQVILPGTCIWRYQPGFDAVIAEADFGPFPAHTRAYILEYSYFDLDRRCFVLSGDDDRFTNHSETPNTREDAQGCTIAARRIAVGEEITADYRTLGWTPFLPVGRPGSLPPCLPADVPDSAVYG